MPGLKLGLGLGVSTRGSQQGVPPNGLTLGGELLTLGGEILTLG